MYVKDGNSNVSDMVENQERYTVWPVKKLAAAIPIMSLSEDPDNWQQLWKSGRLNKNKMH